MVETLYYIVSIKFCNLNESYIIQTIMNCLWNISLLAEFYLSSYIHINTFYNYATVLSYMSSFLTEFRKGGVLKSTVFF